MTQFQSRHIALLGHNESVLVTLALALMPPSAKLCEIFSCCQQI